MHNRAAQQLSQTLILVKTGCFSAKTRISSVLVLLERCQTAYTYLFTTRTAIFANTTKRTCKVQLRLSWNVSNSSCVSLTCTQSTERNDDQSSSEAVETKCDGFQPIKTIFTGYAVLVHICIDMMSRNLRNV